MSREYLDRELIATTPFRIPGVSPSGWFLEEVELPWSWHREVGERTAYQRSRQHARSPLPPFHGSTPMPAMAPSFGT
jgi:hypothetical protein